MLKDFTWQFVCLLSLLAFSVFHRIYPEAKSLNHLCVLLYLLNWSCNRKVWESGITSKVYQIRFWKKICRKCVHTSFFYSSWPCYICTTLQGLLCSLYIQMNFTNLIFLNNFNKILPLQEVIIPVVFSRIKTMNYISVKTERCGSVIVNDWLTDRLWCS